MKLWKNFGVPPLVEHMLAATGGRVHRPVGCLVLHLLRLLALSTS